MKKNAIRILSLFLVVMTLVGAMSLPVSAEIGYPMTYTIYYKVGGKFLGQTSGSCDATRRNDVRIPSPSYDGYLLSNYKDSTVTGSMIRVYICQ